ncbi:MAG: acetate kinase [Holophagaceae bacterium]|nr:acetate kinase [Holophagaceae bacterium]
MIILTLNAGSSSLKFTVINMATEDVLADGIAERIGMKEGFIRWTIKGEKGRLDADMKDHRASLGHIMDKLHETVLKDEKVSGVGHRVTHGGPNFGDPEVITPAILSEIEDLAFYAPLHNPANAMGIKTAMEIFPDVPHVAVFDTAFHHSMPDYAFTYGLPSDLCKKLGLRRYGFHGTSHRFVAEATAELMGRPIEQLKIITCHLGNGSSITAVKNGKSVDTSMGLTPLEGVIMGTRCGSVDPGAIVTIAEKEGLDAKGLSNLLNKHSGLLGVSGISSDCRDVEDQWDTNDQARLTMEMLGYGVLKYIGAYAAAMNGVDAITFTAGIGENGPRLRAWICSHLSNLFGIQIDEQVNNARSKDPRFISKPESRVKVAVVPTNEELAMARFTAKFVQ